MKPNHYKLLWNISRTLDYICLFTSIAAAVMSAIGKNYIEMVAWLCACIWTARYIAIAYRNKDSEIVIVFDNRSVREDSSSR